MPIKFGTTGISSIFKGNTKIGRIYKGTSLVYQSSLLPSGYTECEYLESTGTQYINTEVVGTQNISIDTTFSWSRYLNAWNFFFNAMAGVYDGQWYGLAQASSFRNVRFNMGISTVYTNIAYNDFTAHNYVMENFQITIDGSNTHSISNKSDFTTVYPIAIFANNKKGNIEQYSYAKLYSFKIYDNKVLVRNFIPALDTNHKPCLYDTVTGNTFYNQGTGTFSYQIKS